MSNDLKALRVRPDNLWYIEWYGQERHRRLDDIRSDFELAQEDGFEIYVITDGTNEKNNVVFTVHYASDFHNFWEFQAPEKPYEFIKITRKG